MATTLTRFSTQTIVAYVIGYAIATAAVVIGLAVPSISWLALGVWLAVSLTVLVIDRAIGERTPRPGTSENFGAIFQGSSGALAIIGALAVIAFLVALLTRR